MELTKSNCTPVEPTLLDLVWWSNDSSTSTEELFQLATVKVKDFIQPIVFQTINTTYDPEDEKNVSLF